MRRFALSLIFIGAVAGVAPAASAAAWEQFTNEEWGFTVSFPGKPELREGTYTGRFSRDAKTHYAFLEDANTVYSAAVIEAGRNDIGSAILGDAEFNLTQLGAVVMNNMYRTGFTDYGRFITIDCDSDHAALPEGGADTGQRIRAALKSATGIECPTGARLSTVIHFKNGRLYIIAGVSKPGPNAKRAGGPGRFANSIAWAGANQSIMDKAQQGTETVQ